MKMIALNNEEVLYITSLLENRSEEIIENEEYSQAAIDENRLLLGIMCKLAYGPFSSKMMNRFFNWLVPSR